jgi:uncharacterized sporulation protein YeaH/YhbH (DUF444 family)
VIYNITINSKQPARHKTMFIKYTAIFQSGKVQRLGTIITEIQPSEWNVVNYRFHDENGNNLSDDGELLEILDTEEMSF